MRDSLLNIIDRLKTEIAKLDKNDENYQIRLAALSEEIKYFKNCFFIGVYKKIDQMDREELIKIAFKNMDLEVLNTDSNIFLKEYDEVKTYMDGFSEDVKKKREIISTFDFIVEGRMCVLFNEDGTPKTNIIVPEETKELVKKQFKLKSYPVTMERKISAKVLQDYFTTEELYQLGLHKLSSCDDYIPGFVFRQPNDINDKSNEFYKQYPNVFITFQPSKQDSKKLTSQYDYYEALKFGNKLSTMRVLYPKIILKNRLETDLDYLKQYVKSLVLDPDFIKDFNKNVTMQMYGTTRTMHEVYETTSLDSLEDYDITKYINSKINSI